MSQKLTIKKGERPGTFKIFLNDAEIRFVTGMEVNCGSEGRPRTATFAVLIDEFETDMPLVDLKGVWRWPQ